MGIGTEAQSFVWEGAIPLQIHLHESEITTLPPPPPALILGPRIGYLPLLVPLIKPYFSSTLPPGTDTVWFDYKGLPLKWYIPTGVLFDLLCMEPERPWNLTVHFRGYPGDLLSPCEGEDAVKWSFINSLKEVTWKETFEYHRSSGLELMEKSLQQKNTTGQHIQTSSEAEFSRSSRTGRIPVRLYVRSIDNEVVDLEEAPAVDSWDRISYINRPVEIHRENSKIFTLGDAIKTLLPEFFEDAPSIDEELSRIELEDGARTPETNLNDQEPKNISTPSRAESNETCQTKKAEIKLVRIQGIEPKLDIPFSWVIKNLINPEHFLHMCVCVRVAEDQDKTR